MSYSLEFCKQRASNPNISSYSDRDWNGTAVEHDITMLLDNIFHGVRKYTEVPDDWTMERLPDMMDDCINAIKEDFLQDK